MQKKNCRGCRIYEGVINRDSIVGITMMVFMILIIATEKIESVRGKNNG